MLLNVLSLLLTAPAAIAQAPDPGIEVASRPPVVSLIAAAGERIDAVRQRGG